MDGFKSPNWEDQMGMVRVDSESWGGLKWFSIGEKIDFVFSKRKIPEPAKDPQATVLPNQLKLEPVRGRH